MSYQITTQRDLRKAFWQSYAPNGSRPRKAASKDWPTDTRVSFVDYIDALERDGVISEALAQRATLTP